MAPSRLLCLLFVWLFELRATAEPIQPPRVIDIHSLPSGEAVYEATRPWPTELIENVTGIGDVNGDGFDDFLVGVENASLSSGYQGHAVFLVLGNSEQEKLTKLDGPSKYIVAFKATEPIEHLNYSKFCQAGDVDGDGLMDFLISAPEAPWGAKSFAGRVYLILGAKDLRGEYTIDQDVPGVLHGAIFLSTRKGTLFGSGSLFGSSSIAVGDFNGDRRTDVAMGAGSADVGEKRGAGQVFVLFSMADYIDTEPIDIDRIGVDLPGFVADGEEGAPPDKVVGDDLGRSVACPGDLDGDGFDDLLVGAPRLDRSGLPDGGIVYLIYGSETTPSRFDLAQMGQRGVRIQGPGRVYRATGFGDSITAAGDLNGDGYPDFLVGVMGDCCRFSGPSLDGRVYAVLGGPRTEGSFNLQREVEQGSSRVVVLTEAVSGDRAGSCLAAAGDLNDDGFSDFMVGAYLAERDLMPRAGQAYVIFGGPHLQGSLSLADLPGPLPGILITGSEAFDGLGWKVAGLGDVNGDRLPDFAMTTVQTARPLSAPGDYSRLYVHHGDSGLLPLRLDRAVPSFGSIEGGTSVKILGSGFWGDIEVTLGGKPVVSAKIVSSAEIEVGTPPGESLGQVDVRLRRGPESAVLPDGYEYVRPLPRIDPETPSGKAIAVHGDSTTVWFGVALAAGDLNGDGFSDAVIGSGTFGANGWLIGVLYGMSQSRPQIPLLDLGMGDEGFLLRGEQGTDRNDSIFASVLGDVNGDGLNDLAIATGAPAVYVLFGRRSFSGEITIEQALEDSIAVKLVRNSLPAWPLFPAFRVSALGDVNGDKLPEFAASLPFESQPGEVYIIPGRKTWPAEIDLTSDTGTTLLPSPPGVFQFGKQLAKVEDLDGDGLPDLAVGTHNSDLKVSWVYIFSGMAALRGGSDATMEIKITQGYENFKSTAVSSAGDFNRDGLKDLLIGVEGGGQAFNGQCYVLFGSISLPGKIEIPEEIEGRGVILKGEYPYDQTFAVASLGDFDADGTDDIAIGAPGIHDIRLGNPGKTFVLFGDPTFPSVFDLGRLGGRGIQIPGVVNFGGAGYRVQGAGDFNGDGQHDLIIGERGYGAIPGNAYIILSPFGGKSFRRGDANRDGAIDLSDAVFVLAYLFLGGSTLRCLDAADFDDSGALDVSDPISLLGFLFLGGPQPPPPFPGEAVDPTMDSLSCPDF